MSTNAGRKPTDQSGTPDSLDELRVRRGSPAVGSRDAYQELKERLTAAIRSALDPAIDLSDPMTARPRIHEHLRRLLAEQPVVLNQSEKRQLLEAIINDLSSS